jgi:DNA polymerase III subunit alpha
MKGAKLFMNLIEKYLECGYINLHLHTDASHLDGMNDIKSLIKRLKEIDHKTSAVTDHGNAHNLYKFYKEAIKNGIKPILGVEFYVSYARQLQSKKEFLVVEEHLEDDFILGGDKTHLVVLAKSFEGYQNLCRLVTLSEEQGFYGKPRIDYELLKKHSEDLIVINGHVGTDIARSFERFVETGNKEDFNRAYRLNDWYKEIFGDDYYLEIQNHRLKIEDDLTPHMIELAESSNTKLVMTNDSHYTWKEDADIHRAHMANGLSKTYEEFMGGDFEGFATCDEFYVKSNEEMLEVATEIGDVAIQALLNTHEIVEKCNVEIPFVDFLGVDKKTGKAKWKTKDYLFPNFSIPAPYSSAKSYFEHLSREGLKRRIESNEVYLNNHTIEEYEERLEYEMKVINDMGFPTYFLVLWDIMRLCEEKDIPVGKGRGSGAGSLVCYSLGITDVDPLQFGLIFERFLNPARISMPDYLVA